MRHPVVRNSDNCKLYDSHYKKVQESYERSKSYSYHDSKQREQAEKQNRNIK